MLLSVLVAGGALSGGLGGLVGLTMAGGPGWIYPVSRRVDHVDRYHGISVADPYRWLEAPISTPEVRAWADAQNAFTMGYLERIPGRAALLDELERRVNFERYSLPTRRGSREFYSYNTGLQAQDVMYVVDGPGQEARVLIDPNTLSEDGTVSISATDVSLDGERLLYGVSRAGSDWIEWRVRDVDSGRDLGSPVKWSKFGGGVLDAKGEGFYYLRYPEPEEGEALTAANEGSSIWYHRVGTEQSADRKVFELPEHPERFLFPVMVDSREALFIWIGEPGSLNNRLYAVDLRSAGAPVVKIFDELDGQYGPIGMVGDDIFVQTTKDAPTGSVLSVSLRGRRGPRVVVPAAPENLDTASVVGGKLILQYSKDAHSVVRVVGLDGSPTGEVELPGLGTVAGFAGEPGSSVTYFSYADLTTPTVIFRYDVGSGKREVFRELKLPFDTSKYEARQVFVESLDGTKVPLFLVHRKGLELDGTNPTLLYGYGGFGAGQKPWFSSSRTVWMDMGGVWALACIRGGNEYGKAWHEAATKVRRQNAFDDFIACAEWLIEEGYTSSSRLAIQGGSNGGLLIGAVMNQRPDLFAVCIPEVGVMDMLRFNQFTIGRAWESDYGNPENVDEFFALLRISPYHNLVPGTRYPATLVTTADTDDRVVPAHSFKYAARLQASQGGDAPVLIRIESSAGHGAGTPIRKVLEGVRDIYSFALHNMGVRLREKWD